MNSRTGPSLCECTFSSVFAPYIVRFLEIKEASGCSMQNPIYMLKGFDTYALKHNMTEPCVTKSIYDEWLDTLSTNRASTRYEKISMIGQFCRYLVKLGIQEFIPSYPRKPKREIVPYIFTHEEIKNIFICADRLRIESRTMSSKIFSIPILLRLLYSTGMRIGEACSLLNEDVSLSDGTITLSDTKNNRDRILPISESLMYLINQYIAYRNKLPVIGINDAKGPFLVTLNGNPVCSRSVHFWFHKILVSCGIKYIPKIGPRIHDLRHTFAVHALDKLSKAGKDIYCGLPIISVALGHKCVSDTEYYVRITNQIYPDLNAMTSQIAEYIFPSINLNR